LDDREQFLAEEVLELECNTGCTGRSNSCHILVVVVLLVAFPVELSCGSHERIPLLLLG
jgi:hypothetical protein